MLRNLYVWGYACVKKRHTWVVGAEKTQFSVLLNYWMVPYKYSYFLSVDDFWWKQSIALFVNQPLRETVRHKVTFFTKVLLFYKLEKNFNVYHFNRKVAKNVIFCKWNKRNFLHWVSEMWTKLRRLQSSSKYMDLLIALVTCTNGKSCLPNCTSF